MQLSRNTPADMQLSSGTHPIQVQEPCSTWIAQIAKYMMEQVQN